MPMSDGKIGRWGAVLREAFAVLAAILIAFALDAWWDGRVERDDMLTALEAVRDELQDNIDAIETALTYNVGQADLVAEVLDMTPSDVAGLSDSELARFRDLPNYNILTLRLGATVAFIEGGHLRVLEDRTLRGRIAGLSQIQGEIDEEVQSVVDMSLRLNSAILGEMPLDGMRRPEDLASLAGTRAILLTVVTDPDVRRTLYARTFLLNAVYGLELANQSTALTDLLDRIEGELDP